MMDTRSTTANHRGATAPPSEALAGSQQPSDLALRDTGIGLMGEMPWGTHVCVFYETKRDLLDAIVSYFGTGLRNNEYCVLAVSEPLTIEDAQQALRRNVPNFEGRLANQIEIIPGTEWYLKGGRFDMKRVSAGWDEKRRHGLSLGFAGLRASGNAFWLHSPDWKDFTAYEQEIDRSISGREMLLMCTYSLRAARAMTVLDVVRSHQFAVARRRGEWALLETPELKGAKRQIARLNGALGVLSNRFRDRGVLTERERLVLAHIVTGASSKEVARKLGIGARTVEFHRANIMKKLGAKNTVDLVRMVLAETE